MDFPRVMKAGVDGIFTTAQPNSLKFYKLAVVQRAGPAERL